jgi:hypothetical protein
MITDPKIFYKSFQVNYYDYKQLSLKYILENTDKLNLDKVVLDYNKKDFERAIKSSIRQTYFHAIETLFELIFALCPNQYGLINEVEIIRTISISRFPYKKIEGIAKDEKNLEFLDQEIHAGDKKFTLGHFIFFIGITKKEMVKELNDNLEVIKHGLQILAKDFSDRREYNSYKHGLRIMPALKSFTLASPTNKDLKLTWDLEDSMTFYTENKSGELEFITKTFDSDRDINMTSFCSNLIWNIITLRRARFFKDKQEIPILLFDKDSIDKAQKQNVKIQDLKYKLAPKDK